MTIKWTNQEQNISPANGETFSGSAILGVLIGALIVIACTVVGLIGFIIAH